MFKLLRRSFLIILVISILNYLNIFPHHIYQDSDFNIKTYHSKIDYDLDNIDDQTDILNSALKYLNTKPKYQSKYYESGYPTDNYGVCTDVVAFALKGAGYDLQSLVNEDIIKNRQNYHITNIDKNIDFRRVNNLTVYFFNNYPSLTLELKDISNWQSGDIVIFKNHIGIISNHRNKKGIPYVLHHAHKNQLSYEEDILEKSHIVGHFRIS